MVDVQYIGRPRRQNPFQFFFSCQQGQARQVFSVEREQIKGEVSGEVTPLHHVSKDASAEMVDHDEFAI